jgi:hypothetical protein
VLLAPRRSAQEEEKVLTALLVVAIATDTARRKRVPLASTGHHSLVSDGVVHGSKQLGAVLLLLSSTTIRNLWYEHVFMYPCLCYPLAMSSYPRISAILPEGVDDVAKIQDVLPFSFHPSIDDLLGKRAGRPEVSVTTIFAYGKTVPFPATPA